MWRLLVILMVALTPIGCSATVQATKAAQVAQKHLEVAEGNCDLVIDETLKETPDPKVIRDLTTETKTHVVATRAQIDSILVQIPKMEDKVPYWLQVLYLLGIVGCLSLVWVLLERTGAMTAIRELIWSFGLLIPKASKTDAKVLSDLEKGDKTPKEVTQYFRTKYPDINAAIDLRKRKKAGATPSGNGSP